MQQGGHSSSVLLLLTLSGYVCHELMLESEFASAVLLMLNNNIAMCTVQGKYSFTICTGDLSIFEIETLSSGGNSGIPGCWLLVPYLTGPLPQRCL